MIIEFIGVPASGKTTISVGLVDELNSIGYKTEIQFPIETDRLSRYLRLFKKLTLCIRAVIFNTSYSLKLLKLLLSIKTLSPLLLLNLLANGLYIKGLSLNAEKSAISTVFHQGFIQYIYSIGKVADEKQFDGIAKTMLNWRPHIDQVVFVKAASTLVKERLANRSQAEKNKLGHISTMNEIEMSERLMSQLYTHLKDCSVQVTIVDSNASIPPMSVLLPNFKGL